MRLLVFLSLLASASAIVAGVDLGIKYMKISLVKPGAPFEIVTNVHSGRKTETQWVLDGGERAFGGDAVTLGQRKPHKTYPAVRGYLGRTAEHPWVASRGDAYVAMDAVWNETRGGLQLPNADGEGFFLAEEVAAMTLSHAREITAAFAEAPVKDVVLTVPMYFTQSERQALLDAAAIAGFNVLALVDENGGAAIQYSIDRLYENATHRVLFYNMGAGSLQVSIHELGAYQHKGKAVGQTTTLAKAWDESLGGEAFELRVVEELADAFNAQYRKVGGPDFDVRAIARPMAKLRGAAEKAKTVLSANTQRPVHVAGLYDDRDLATKITRERFEELSADLFDRALLPVQEALRDAGLEPSDIDAVELLGGGTRVPRLQQLLREFFGEVPIGAHLNTDEAPALGAAFHAANLSTAFRVRQVGFTDTFPFAVDAHLTDLPASPSASGLFGFLAGGEAAADEDAWTKHASPFPRYTPLKTPKKVSFTHSRDIAVQFRHPEEEDKLPAAQPRMLAEYTVAGVADFAAEMAEQGLGEPKVTLSFALGADGIVRVVKAEATVEELPPPPPVAEESEEEEGESDEEEEAAAAEDAVAEGEEGEEEAADGEEEEAEADKEAKKSKKDKKSKKSKKSKKKKSKEEEAAERIKVHRRKLRVTRVDDDLTVRPLNGAELSSALDMLAAMQTADDARRENAAAKNDLESSLYAARGRLDDNEEAVAAVSTEEQRQAVTDMVLELEDWLYEDGDDETAPVYRAKQREVTKLADDILFRVAEATDRPAAVAKARENLQTTRDKLGEWREDRPQITDDDHEQVGEVIGDIERWLGQKLDEQQELQPHEDPAFTSDDVVTQMKRLRSLVTKLAKKPKPEPPKSEDSEEESVEEEDLDASQDQEEAQEEEAQEEEAQEEEALEEEAAKEHDDL